MVMTFRILNRRLVWPGYYNYNDNFIILVQFTVPKLQDSTRYKAPKKRTNTDLHLRFPALKNCMNSSFIHSIPNAVQLRVHVTSSIELTLTSEFMCPHIQFLGSSGRTHVMYITP